MPVLTDTRYVELHCKALAEFSEIQKTQKDERLQCLQDRRFYSVAGAQWEGPLEEQYESKPKMEVNKVHLAVIRIINEYRNNRIDVDFVEKTGSPEGLAQVCNDLMRSDEQDSNADEALDNAFEESVGGGIGAWRYRACDEDEYDSENDHQRIRIEPIYDADSCVFFDLQAKRQDKSDAKRCFVLSSMTEESYKEEYEDDPTSWPKEIETSEFDWNTEDAVYVAEYYETEEYEEKVYFYESIQGDEERYTQAQFDEEPGLKSQVVALGGKFLRSRKVKSKRIHKYILSGGGVLEDSGLIAGKNIPVVMEFGKRWFVDNVERAMGHVRLAKDAQRLKNMQVSKLAEIAALSSVQKPIFTREQMAGNEIMWSEDNIKNYPYMLINTSYGLNGEILPSAPMAYTKPPDIPPALAALLQVSEIDIKEILGNQQGGEQIVSNISGKAVEMIQQRLDMQTFIYVSNFAKARKRGGEIWLSMAKEIYLEKGRQMKAVDKNKTAKMIEIMRPNIGSEGQAFLENDLKDASFDVATTVGPSSASKKSATVRELTALLAVTEDPEMRTILGSMIIMHTEGEGISDINEFFRKKLVRMGVIKPTDTDKAEMEAESKNQKPSANDEYLQAAADEARSNAEHARAKTGESMAATSLKQAQTQETLAGIDRDDLTAVEGIVSEQENSIRSAVKMNEKPVGALK